MSTASGNDHIGELDQLFDEDPVDLRKVEHVILSLTHGIVHAILQQRVEVLTAPYMAGLNRLLHEINWRCEENPSNMDLHIIKGRIMEAIDMVDVADDTAISQTTVDYLKARPEYLLILKSLLEAENHHLSIEGTGRDGSFDSVLDWLQDRQLIARDGTTITIGPKTKAVFDAAIKELN